MTYVHTHTSNIFFLSEEPGPALHIRLLTGRESIAGSEHVGGVVHVARSVQVAGTVH